MNRAIASTIFAEPALSNVVVARSYSITLQGFAWAVDWATGASAMAALPLATSTDSGGTATWIVVPVTVTCITRAIDCAASSLEDFVG
jgi:hypothetical protein